MATLSALSASVNWRPGVLSLCILVTITVPTTSATDHPQESSSNHDPNGIKQPFKSHTQLSQKAFSRFHARRGYGMRFSFVALAVAAATGNLDGGGGGGQMRTHLSLEDDGCLHLSITA